MYVDGEGVPQDYKKAIYWFTRAAKQGHAIAQNNLGVIYYHGKGVSRDYIKAYAWFKLAALQGDATVKNTIDFVQKKMSPRQIDGGQKLYEKLYEKIYNKTK